MTKYIKTDHEGLVKDPNSGAILSVDNQKLNAYKKQKAFFNKKEQDSARIDKLEQDIGDIKQMLTQLITSFNK
jgi:hypothetical protein